VFFEDGQVVATLGEDMNWVMYRASHELTEEDLLEPRPPAGPGERLSIAIADSLGQRAEQRASGIFALVKLREASSGNRP
jgi:hypothetical protein